MKYVKILLFIAVLFTLVTGATAQELCMKSAEASHINGFAFEDDYLWVATDGGVLKYNTLDDTYELFTTAEGLADNYVTSVAVASDGVKWFGTFYGICSYDGSSWVTYTVASEGFKSDLISAVAEVAPGTMWFGTIGEGVITWDGAEWGKKTIYSGLTSNYVNNISVAADGSIWVGTTTGVTGFIGEENVKYAEFEGNSVTSVNAVAVGENGEKWFATYGGGISWLYGDEWRTYTTDDGLPANHVSVIVIDQNGVIWIGTTGTGVVSISGSTWNTTTEIESTVISDVRAIAVDSNNVKWVGTADGSIFKFDAQQPPAPPTDITGESWENEGTTGVTLDWVHSIDQETISGYKVYRSKYPVFTQPTIAIADISSDELEQAELTKTIYLGSVEGNSFEESLTVPGGEYYYWVSAFAGEIESEHIIFSLSVPILVGVEDVFPQAVSIKGAYPNPFNPSTTIEYSLPRAMDVTLTVYNIAGQEVSILKNGYQNAGTYSALWNARGMSTGMYIAVLNAGGNLVTKKLLLVR